MISTKSNLTLFVIMTLSMTSIIAMKRNQHTVTIKNYLSQSAVMVKKTEYTSIDNATYIKHQSHEINPLATQQVSLIPQNNVSHLKLLLPNYYKQSSVTINITKDNEEIHIGPKSPKENSICIMNTSGENIATIEALISPALYKSVKKLVLEEMEENKKKTEDHTRKVTITNHYLYYDEITVTYVPENCNEQNIATQLIEPNSKKQLAIKSQNGKTSLLFLLSHFFPQLIALDLDDDQNITIKQGQSEYDIIIKNDTTQLACARYLSLIAK